MVFERCVPEPGLGNPASSGSVGLGHADTGALPKGGAPYVILTLAEALHDRSLSAAIDALASAHRQQKEGGGVQSTASGPTGHHSAVDHNVNSATTANSIDAELFSSQCARMADVFEARVSALFARQQAELAAEVEKILNKMESPLHANMLGGSIAASPDSPTLGAAMPRLPGPVLTEQASRIQASHQDGGLFGVIAHLDDTDLDENDYNDTRVRKTDRLKALAAREAAGTIGMSPLEQFAHSVKFEVCSLMMIVLNVVVMATELHYLGIGLGNRLGYPGYDKDSDEAMPHAEVALRVVAFVFLCLFTIELGIRIAGRGPDNLCRPGWIWFDSFMVALACLNVLEDWKIWAPLDISPVIARLLRLVRITRVLRIVSSLDNLQSLFLLVKSIQASVSACFWSLTALVGLMTVFGICLAESLSSYMNDENQPLVSRQELFKYFGTFTRLLVSMFEITLGNWIPPCRLLMETAGQGFGLAIVAYRCVLCFAVVRVINAVFITETHRVAASDDEVALMRRERTASDFMSKLEDLFTELDADGDGKLSTKEFNTLMHDKLIKKFMGSLEIDTSDVQTLFSILDDGDGEVLKDEFMHGLHAIRGTAKGISTIEILNNVRRIEKKIVKIDKRLVQAPLQCMPASHWRQSQKPSEAPAS